MVQELPHLKKIAAMDAKKIAQLDDDLKLGGRTEREEWIEQSKRIACWQTTSRKDRSKSCCS